MYISIREDYPLWFELISWVVTIIGTAKNTLRFMAFMSGLKEGYGKRKTDKGV